MRGIGITLLLAAVSSVLATISLVSASKMDGGFSPRCPNSSNPFPLYTSPPVFLRSVKQGKLFVAGNEKTNDEFWIQHLYGTPYEMGYASGVLNAKQIPPTIQALYQWVEQQAESKVSWLCKGAMLPICNEIIELGAFTALHAVWQTTAPFCPKFISDELQGIADGATSVLGGNSTELLEMLQALNSMPSIIKAQCSAIGALGKATSGGFLQALRSLDGMGGDTMPLKLHPFVTVYHESTPGTNVVATFGWLGFAGTVTALAGDPVTNFTSGMFLGEKAWSSGSQFDVWAGTEFSFVYRMMLRGSRSVKQAETVLLGANRTCSVHTSIGIYNALQPNRSEFEITLSAHGVFMRIHDYTYNYKQHPKLNDVTYIDKFGQPTKSYCFGDTLTHYYGELTAEIMALDVAARLGTGDLHIMTYDSKLDVAYFANARKAPTDGGHIKACHRQFTALRMSDLYNEKPPQ